MIADAGSLHGTFLNNTKLTCDSLLRIGDKIKFGDSVSRSSCNPPRHPFPCLF